MTEKDIDVVTSATVRARDKESDGSGHTVLKLSGIKNQDDLNTVAQAIFDVEGVVAVKVFDTKDKAMYDVEHAVDSADVIKAIAAVGATAEVAE